MRVSMREGFVHSALVAGIVTLALVGAAAQPIAQKAPSAPTSESLTAAANIAIRAFGGGCGANVGKAEDVIRDIESNGFLPAPPQITAALLRGEPGRVWLFPRPDIGVAVLLQPDGMRCRVWVQRGDVDVAASAFVRLVEGVAGRGIAVEKERDGPPAGDGGGQPVHQIVYRVGVRPPLPDRADLVFALTTNRSPTASVQIVFTVYLDAPRTPPR
jgi:hypothetical protein